MSGTFVATTAPDYAGGARWSPMPPIPHPGLQRARAAPNLLGVGGAHVDRRGRMAAPFVPGASIPGALREDIGGGVFNALRAARRLGADCSLFSVRGGDADGESVARAVGAARITDLSAVFLDRATPTYTAMLSQDGELITALADMELYEIGFLRQMRRHTFRAALENAAAVICDANLPAAALRALFELRSGKPVFAIAVSPAKVIRFKGMLDQVRCLFLNRREAAGLADVERHSPTDLLRGLGGSGLAGAVVTDGPRRIVGFDGPATFSLQPPVMSGVVDVTGAGDALAGATALACVLGLPLAEAVRHGIAAARLAISSDRSAPNFSMTEFNEALAQVPAAEPLT